MSLLQLTLTVNPRSGPPTTYTIEPESRPGGLRYRVSRKRFDLYGDRSRSGVVSASDVHALRDRLAAIRLPPFAAGGLPLDWEGSCYHLEVGWGDVYTAWRWCGDPPEAWIPLAELMGEVAWMARMGSVPD